MKEKKSLVILDSSIQFDEFKKFSMENTTFVAADYETHKKLTDSNTKHELLDNYLQKKERLELYDFVLSKYTWYENLSRKSDFEFNNINILSLMSPLEFHEFILTVLIKQSSIKNVISSKCPNKIFVSEKFLKYVELVQDKNKIHTFNSNLKTEKSFLTDKIELRFNILSKPCTFYISKKNYSSLKKIYENFFCKINNLWLDKKTSKEIILLVEFNTSAYEEMIRTLSKSKKQLVILNRRRSAIWNKDSISILKSNNVKILDPEKFFDSHVNSEFLLEHKRLNENLHELWESKELFSIFSMGNLSFWPLIKDRLKKIYDYRLDDYLKFIFQSRNFLAQLNIEKIICLGESGETENILLQSIKNHIDSILLQHSFLRYNNELNDLQWRYEDQKMIGLKSKNFFVWGNHDLNYFSEKSSIKREQIIISGTPRHDIFFKRKTYEHSKKIKNILITLSPISERSGLGDTNLIIKYNRSLIEIINMLKEFNDTKITVKLHPGENPHNSILLNLLETIPDIIIYQTKNPEDLIVDCDFLVNVSPELYDSSTIMLEGLILKKPVVQLILYGEFSEITPLESPIIQVQKLDDFKQIAGKIIENEPFRKLIIEKIPEKLNNYLSYQNHSSSRILELIDNKN